MNSDSMNVGRRRRNTAQKQIILDTLIKLGSHVSASTIYRELQTTNPEIGRATVFRVLSDMAEDGNLMRVTVAGSDDRFDITTRPHCHVHCRVCGKVDDIWFDCEPELIPLIKSASGFTVENEHIEFAGICRECQANGSLSQELSGKR